MEVKETEIIEKATEFENRRHVYKSTNEKIVASREVKSLILELNEIYKENKDFVKRIFLCIKIIKFLVRTYRIAERMERLSYNSYYGCNE